ncbi:MAG: T9SS type A sorting domain-containing protein [bacterium]|nr:T9SS type A sorting domain-containing protein [bacterium]
MRTKISLILGLFLFSFLAVADNPAALTGAETYPVDIQTVNPKGPDLWGLDYVGSPETIGNTWYDYQHNSSMSRMIAYGSDGTVHCCWMNGLQSGAAQRLIYYNRKDPSGTWAYGTTGLQVNTVIRAGYCTMDLDADDDPVIAYHGLNTGTVNTVYVYTSTGEHACPAPPVGVTEVAWPHVAVDTRGYIHVVGQSNPVGTLYYTRSIDGGLTWIDWQTVVTGNTSGGVCQTVCSDLATGKVAIGYTKPLGTAVNEEDVFYVESTDGTTWNFTSPVNITNFAAGGHPMSSNSRAYCSCNLLYDSAGRLHITYTTNPYPLGTGYAGMIWHWSLLTGHRKVTGTFTANAWTAISNNPGVWKRAIDIAAFAQGTAANTLYVQWGQCTTPGDVSLAGIANWDVFVTYSTDGGVNWMSPVNVTATATPGAPAGQCLSEAWASIAKKASSKLHVQYIKDLDAGGAVQTQGAWTLNPVIYQGIPTDSILTNMQVTATPSGPVIIPPQGGSIPLNAVIRNLGQRVVHIDVWIQYVHPDSTYNLLNRQRITMQPGGIITRTLNAVVGGGYPAGTYTFQLRVGDLYWSVWGQGSFQFTKTGMDASAGSVSMVTGWDNPETSMGIVPETHLMVDNYPNPFNPATVISFELPAVSFVNLSVYDISGKQVAELVNGMREAGRLQISFDGSDLPSGVYLCRLQAGGNSVVQKMVLLK